MASTYSTSLKLELIGNGDQSGTWGTTTNNNLGTLLEQAIVGQTTISMNNANYTLSNYNGTSDEARNAVIIISGNQNASYVVNCPAVQKLYVITNSLNASATAYFGPTGGSTLTIPNGYTVLAYCTGTTMVALAGLIGNQTINGNTSVGGNLTVTGTTALSGTATAPTPTFGDNSTNIATTAFVAQNAILTGAIQMWPTASAPTGYLLCNGAAVSRTTYAALYGVIGTTFGAGDTTTTFNLPNYTNRMPIGVGSIAALAATGGSADAIVVSHTHTATSTVTDPGHAHVEQYNGGTSGAGNGISDSSVSVGPTASSVSTATATTGITVATTNASAGVSGTNANLPPYLGINFIIKT
jgi:microcystin-dependent protein